MTLFHRSREESSFQSFPTGTSSKPNTLGIAESSSTSPPPIKPSPVNILEVEVDEEAFKETSPVRGHFQGKHIVLRWVFLFAFDRQFT